MITESHYANVSLYDPGTLAPPGAAHNSPMGVKLLSLSKEITLLLIIIIMHFHMRGCMSRDKQTKNIARVSAR